MRSGDGSLNLFEDVTWLQSAGHVVCALVEYYDATDTNHAVEAAVQAGLRL